MKTKRKEKEKKEEKKRSEVLPRFELGPFGASGECFTTRPRGTLKKSWRNFIIKTFEPTWIQRYFSEEWLQFGQWKPNVNAFHRIYM